MDETIILDQAGVVDPRNATVLVDDARKRQTD